MMSMMERGHTGVRESKGVAIFSAKPRGKRIPGKDGDGKTWKVNTWVYGTDSGGLGAPALNCHEV